MISGVLASVTGVRTVPKHRRMLGDNLRSARKKAGLSQEQLAEKAELHPVYVSAVERGAKTISMDALVRIAKALRVPMQELVSGM